MIFKRLHRPWVPILGLLALGAFGLVGASIAAPAPAPISLHTSVGLPVDI